MAVIDETKLLKIVNPTLAAEWHLTLNTELNINTIYANSGKKAWWQCSTCSYEWLTQVASRNAGRGCANCAGKVVNDSNSLMSLFPEIARQYHPTMNIKPVEKVTAVSHVKAWWQCDDNKNHIWQASVGNRTRQGDGCPYCSGRYPTPENNLAVIHPEIAAEFDLQANHPLTPEDFTPSSNKKVTWKCPQNHNWQVSINSRIRSGNYQYCPYCTGTKATHDNNLSVTHPKIAKQYHSTLNTVPVTEIRYGSPSHKWWQCSINEKHVWEASVSSRTRADRPTGCPECSPTPRTSSVEIAIKKEIKDQQILTNIPETYNAFIPLPNGTREAVDIYGEYGDNKIAIEYDSWWWHSGKGSNKTYESHAERDIRKTIKLLNAGYIVIRIREQRSHDSLPPLQLDKPNLHQIEWNQSAGLKELTDKIKTYLSKL